MTKTDTKNFVDALHKGDNIKAGEAFKGTMADKVTSALDNQKVDVAKSLFTGAVGFKAPEANVFSGNDLEAETSTPDVGAGDENAQ